MAGVNSVVSGFAAVENAQRRLSFAQQRQADLIANGKDTMASFQALQNASAMAQQAGDRLAGRFLGPAILMFKALADAARDATETYTEFAKSASNLRDITGSSGADAARAETVFRGFGIRDTQAMRDMLRLSRDTMTPHGQQALQQLGIDPRGGATGLALLNQVADALEKVQSGTAKAALEQQIFGVRGVDAFLPYLRAGKAARDQMADLSTVTEENLQVAQKWEIANAMLGATWEQKVVFPIVGLVMPALIGLVNGITTVINTIGEINKFTGGWAGFAVMLALIAGSAAALLNSLVAVTAALGTSTAALWLQNAALATRDALLGPAGWAALAVAGITVAGFSMWNASHPASTAATDAHTLAMVDHTKALNKSSEWGGLLHSGIPSGLNDYDVQQLARRMALNSIG